MELMEKRRKRRMDGMTFLTCCFLDASMFYRLGFFVLRSMYEIMLLEDAKLMILCCNSLERRWALQWDLRSVVAEEVARFNKRSD
eukprot:1411236-Ditylum_brightwellii.AAC.1